MAVGAMAAAAGVAGCAVGVKHTLSTGSVQSTVAHELAADYRMKAPPSVVCPAHLPVGKGDVFHCTAMIDGQKLPITGTETNTSGDFSVAADVAVVEVSTSTKSISSQLAAQLKQAVAVACSGPPLVVAAAGKTINCTAQVAGQARTLIVDITSDQGTERWRLLPATG